MSGHSLQIKIDGRTYAGTYEVDRQILTVKTSHGKKAAPIPPRMGHHDLAEQVLPRTRDRGEGPEGFASLTSQEGSPYADSSLRLGRVRRVHGEEISGSDLGCRVGDYRPSRTCR